MIIEYIENGDVAIYNGYRFRRDKKPDIIFLADK